MKINKYGCEIEPLQGSL